MTATVLPPERSVHVEHCMGTVFSIDVRGAGDPATAVSAVVAWLHHVDRVFSTYRDDSDISRLRRREITLARCDPDVAVVLDLCATVRSTTGGWFTPMWDGAIDPTGLVKGWAVEQASTLLAAHGFPTHCVNGGGDVRVAGGRADPWRIGVADPVDRTRTATTVTLAGGAVATSGTAERGEHIRDPFTQRPVRSSLLSATVVGPTLTFADAYATAAFAMGATSALEWVGAIEGYELLMIDGTGRRHASSGWPHLAVDPSRPR